MTSRYPTQEPPCPDHLNTLMNTVIENYEKRQKYIKKTPDTNDDDIDTFGEDMDTGNYKPKKDDIYCTLRALSRNKRHMTPFRPPKTPSHLPIPSPSDNEYREITGHLREEGMAAYLCSFCEKVTISGSYRLLSSSCNRHSYCPTCTSFILRYTRTKKRDGKDVIVRKYTPGGGFVKRKMYNFRCIHAYKDITKLSSCSWRGG